MSNSKPGKKTTKEKTESKIHEPLSSYYPPPFEVDNPTQQNKAPEYYGHGAVYVRKDDPEKLGGNK